MKEYKFKINGKEYNVAVNGIEGNIADVTVNGNSYSVEVEGGCVEPAGGNGAPQDQGVMSAGIAGGSIAPGDCATLGTIRGGTTQRSGVVGPERSEGATGGNTAASGPQVTNAPAGQGNGTDVNSPLPGDVIEVSVKEGDAVKKGQKVAVIEAMKMENDILAECDGTVTKVHVTKGDHVDDGARIVTIA